MEEIRRFVDEMITWAGITGDYVPMLRHILLTITAILLSMLSDFLCRKIVVPLISKITEKTEKFSEQKLRGWKCQKLILVS